MQVVLLGGIAVLAGDGGALDLGPARQRCVLAALAVDAGRVVSVDRLVARVWGDDPPLRARATLLNYLSRLRLLLTDAGTTVVARRPGGYALDVEPSAVDLHRFRALCVRARASDDRQAVELLRQALELWRGEALTGVEGDWAAAERDRLHQQLLDAECDLTDVLLRLGHGEDLVASLTARTAQWPLDERVAAQFMLALHRAGRTADALAHYRQVRDRLVDQLGTEPGAPLRESHLQILQGEPPDRTEPVAAVCELPPDLPDYIGHGEAVAAALSVLTTVGEQSVRQPVVISGQGGVGKTVMSVHVAHSLRARFPDKQLFLSFGGGRGEPVEPAEALARALRGLGVSDADQPRDVDERAARYRAELSGQRILVVLDDVASARQVQPFLAGGSDAAVLVSSRARLTTLPGAHHIELDVLSAEEAHALLVCVVGADRVHAEPRQAARLVELCARLPLAIRIAGARLAAKPHWSVERLVTRLSDERRRLDELSMDDLEVRASLAIGYRGLAAGARRAFQCLGHLDPADFTTATVAALLNIGMDDAEDLVEQMADARLMEVVLTDGRYTRYRMHDLVRLYARERAVQDADATELRTSVARALTAYVALADHVGEQLPVTTPRLYRPGWLTAPAAEWCVAFQAGGRRLFDAEEQTMIAAVERAAALGLDELACTLADALVLSAFALRNNFDGWERTHAAALAAARTAGNHRAEAALECSVGELRYTQDRFPESRHSFTRAAELFRAVGDDRGVAISLNGLGTVGRELGEHVIAIPQLREACRALQQIGDLGGMAHAHYGLGFAHRELGADATAVEHLCTAIELYQRIGHRCGEMIAVRAIGLVHRARGELEPAERFCADAHGMAEDIGNSQLAAYTAQALAKVWIRRGDAGRALPALAAALETVSTMRDHEGSALVIRTIGEAHLAEGRIDEALRHLSEAAAIWEKIGLPLGHARTLRDLAAAEHRRGHRTRAHAIWADCLRTFRRLGTREQHELAEWRTRWGCGCAEL
jgi:DNA-binding SARP family transcriptional activator/tetratricopeptide (TPR) repeat protein